MIMKWFKRFLDVLWFGNVGRPGMTESNNWMTFESIHGDWIKSRNGSIRGKVEMKMWLDGLRHVLSNQVINRHSTILIMKKFKSH